LAPQNLSRTLEDSGTVTSVLIPWNTCGAAQSNVLGVATFTYLPYCFFNIISPFMTVFFAYAGIKIAQLKGKSDNEIG
ncbi:MAG: sodium:proton antiporter, partial [Cyclobacteriaceae bacterium]|nr:sodium:proton antiporter [Cyclobacteriaceae bacterium]